MSPTLIVDCSMAMAWHFPDERTDETAAILDRLASEEGLVPAHWVLEVTNVLITAVKRKRTTEERADAFLELLLGLKLESEPAPPLSAMPAIIALCRTHGLTSYDAAYLELAHRRGLPLASLDDPLRAAAVSLGLTVLGK